ncbi:MAG: response regulator transcription factor [Candidatus Dadabacteria bacterium]
MNGKSTIQLKWKPMNSLNGNGNLLTDRERLVLKLIAKGCSRKQIAERLFISIDTVKKHLQNTYRKLGAGNKIEALVRAGIIGGHS